MASIDRLSGLPDELICHILSLLSTKLSVSTSALAKRWRFMWAHVPILVFSGYDFNDNANDSIIQNVVALHKAKIIHTFIISDVDSTATEYQLMTWITYAIHRSVRNLCVDFFLNCYKGPPRILFTLPGCLLTSKTLVDLKLSRCRGIPSTGEVLLPGLKKLRLSFVEYEDAESLPHLLSGCPVLEDLIIDYCFREEQKDFGCVAVSSPTLTKLDICFFHPSEFDIDYLLTINAPALRYLFLDRCSFEHMTSLRTMTSLIQADFFLNGCWTTEGIYDYFRHERVVEFLNCLCNVKCLNISSHHDEILVDIVGVGSIVKFDNLTKLELRFMIVDWYDLVKFLQVANNLEVLVFESFYLDWKPYREPERVPTCMLSCLKIVTSYIPANEHCCFDTVRYILRNALVLEKMEIYDVYCGLDVLEEISLFELGSMACELAIY